MSCQLSDEGECFLGYSSGSCSFFSIPSPFYLPEWGSYTSFQFIPNCLFEVITSALAYKLHPFWGDCHFLLIHGPVSFEDLGFQSSFLISTLTLLWNQRSTWVISSCSSLRGILDLPQIWSVLSSFHFFSNSLPTPSFKGVIDSQSDFTRMPWGII